MSELSVGALSGLAANSYVVDVASGSTLDLSNGAVFPAGNVIQVVSTTKTDTFSTTSQTMTDITGLSASITPRSTSSKILVNVSIGQTDSSATNTYGWQIVRDSTAVAIGDASGNRQRTTVGGGAEAARNQPAAVMFLDSPATTSSTTYKVQIRGAGQTVYVNRADTDDDQTYRFRGVSTITVMEIAG